MSIGFTEILVILVVAFVVVGPKDLPKVARALAKCIKKIRSAMKSLTDSFEEELEMEEMKKTQQEMRGMQNDFEKAQQEVLRHAELDKDDVVKEK
ncbi:MAG: Sec-independent protein translocase protein TatB [Phascolarctobacterium sp.]|nr:Sec-independent protein translocase protein TatB [Phascolarctobacterium sp.]